MLLEFQTMTEEEMYRMVHGVHSEGSIINAKWRHPEKEDLSREIQEEEQYFMTFLREKFFPQERNRYYVLEVDEHWVSALRLTKIDDFYYLEALETAPEQRKKGYGTQIIEEVIQLLKKRGPVIIRSNVAKDNWASLATHQRCGFQIEEENGINYRNGEQRDTVYGLIYQGK